MFMMLVMFGTNSGTCQNYFGAGSMCGRGGILMEQLKKIAEENRKKFSGVSAAALKALAEALVPVCQCRGARSQCRGAALFTVSAAALNLNAAALHCSLFTI